MLEGGKEGGGRRGREGWVEEGGLGRGAEGPSLRKRFLQSHHQRGFGSCASKAVTARMNFLPPRALAGHSPPAQSGTVTLKNRERGSGQGLWPSGGLGRPPQPHGQCQQSRRIPGATWRSGRVGGEGRRLWWAGGGSRTCGGRGGHPGVGVLWPRAKPVCT